VLQFKDILVPLDFSFKNQTAVDIALDLARGNNAKVTLLHVIETIDLPGDREVDGFVSQLKTKAGKNLEKMAKAFEDANVPVETTIRVGKRAQEIARFEQENNIDLIVLSSHTIDAEHPARSLATLSYQVAVLANCHVMLVK